jgi:hypothetical protein
MQEMGDVAESLVHTSVLTSAKRTTQVRCENIVKVILRFIRKGI